MEVASQKPRLPLSRERVLRGAVALADERGLEALTMRNLGQQLGVEAMSLYNHAAFLFGISMDYQVFIISARSSCRPWWRSSGA